MTNLITMIEQAFAYGRGRKKEAHWPSEVTSCPRQIVYSWRGMGETNPIDAGGWWKIQLGNAIHELCQATLERIEADETMKAELAWPEFHVDKEVRSGKVPVEGLKYPVSYRLDNRFVDDDGKLAIAEYKTTFGFGVRAIKEEGPKDSALAQAIIYQKLSGIERAYIMYVSRDNADRVLFIIDMVPEGWILSRMYPSGELNEMKRFPASLWGKMIEKLQAIEAHVEAETLPDRPYRVAIKNCEVRDKFQKAKVTYKSDWQCMYCSYQTRCWGEIALNYPEDDNSADFPVNQVLSQEEDI